MFTEQPQQAEQAIHLLKTSKLLGDAKEDMLTANAFYAHHSPLPLAQLIVFIHQKGLLTNPTYLPNIDTLLSQSSPTVILELLEIIQRLTPITQTIFDGVLAHPKQRALLNVSNYLSNNHYFTPQTFKVIYKHKQIENIILQLEESTHADILQNKQQKFIAKFNFLFLTASQQPAATALKK